MTAPIPDCPAPDYPLRERAWTAEQMAAQYADEYAPEPITDYASRRGE